MKETATPAPNVLNGYSWLDEEEGRRTDGRRSRAVPADVAARFVRDQYAGGGALLIHAGRVSARSVGRPAGRPRRPSQMSTSTAVTAWTDSRRRRRLRSSGAASWMLSCPWAFTAFTVCGSFFSQLWLLWSLINNENLVHWAVRISHRVQCLITRTLVDFCSF